MYSIRSQCKPQEKRLTKSSVPVIFFSTVPAATTQRDIYILHVEGVEDRNQTELMRGMEVEVPASALPKRTDGTYYYHELLGLKVVTEEGEPVGILKEIIETKANNVYSVISEEGKETLIPAIPPCILHVDPAGGTMTVRLLEWE